MRPLDRNVDGWPSDPARAGALKCRAQRPTSLAMDHDAQMRAVAVRRNDADSELELAARARERRTQAAADRRELRVEAAVAALFVVAALALWRLHGGGADPLTAVLIAAVCAVLVRVEFEVGEGCTRPVQLVLAPALVVLPIGVVPVAIAAGHVAAQLPAVARGRIPPRRLIMSLADSWFSLAPAVIVGVVGLPASWPACAALVIAAALGQFVLDFAVSGVRACIGAGFALRGLLRPFAWVWLVDALLIPVGVFAALVAHRAPVAIVGVLPLAALLAVFARERTGRIDNAMELQRLAQEGQDRLQSIVQNSSDLIAILGSDGMIRTLTGSVEAIFGPDWEAAQGASLLDRVHPEDAAPVAAFLTAVSAKSVGDSQEGEWRMRYADGSHRHIAAVATNLLDDARVGGIVLTARDVNDRKAFEEQLRHRAFHDALTGLANRALFYDRIEHALAGGTRADAQLAVLFLDLDDFKAVNDARGHAEGDRLLELVARRITSCLRSGDTAARLGGDEFGILLQGVTGPDVVVRTGERLLTALAQPFEVGEQRAAVSASVGMVLSASGDRGVEEMLRRADLAMYEAKRNGKRRAQLYHAGLEHAGLAGSGREAWFARNDEIREEIRDVLDDPDAVAMVFQPIMDLRTGRVAGYESLARFAREPRRTPDVWFAQAHRCGLGYALEAKAVAAALTAPGRPAGTYLTVNLSPSSLLSQEVLRALPDRLDDLVIEITEHELLSDDPAIGEAIADLRARGARLAVDDTGAGYAGLTHVIRLQPDIIKLDRALTTGVDTDPVKAALIGSFVRYARDIDATVCAEGVETVHELERLADLDVAYGQGYAIARPSAPWAEVAPEASSTCVASFRATLADAGNDGSGESDRRLEALARRLADAVSAEDLTGCLPSVARQLGADEERLVAAPDGEHLAVHTLAGDPATPRHDVRELHELGYGSRLSLPIVHRGAARFRLEAFARRERPWTRFEIGRARLICHQLGPALERAAGT